MRRLNLHAIGMRLAGLLALVGIGFGIWMWTSLEKARAHDIMALSYVSQFRLALDLYYKDHGAYPSALAPLVIPSNQVECLSKRGFASRDVCDGDTAYMRLYGSRGISRTGFQELVYSPKAEDEESACVSKVGCPSYRLSFSLASSIFAPKKGLHWVTPNGIR